MIPSSFVVERLTKESYFISVKSTHKTDDIAKIFMKEIFKLHGLPKAIIYDRDTKFPSNFWKGLFVDLGTKLNFSTAYHPQTDGQTERVNHVLEDMLHMYVMDKPSKWEDYLHLIEFAFNNGQQASLGMSPYEALYVDLTNMKCDAFVNLSTTTMMESCCLIVIGNPIIKSMEMTCHFHSGIGKGCNKLAGC